MAFHSTYSPTFDCLATVGAASPTTALGNNTLAAWVNFNSLATDGEIIEVNASGGGNGSFDSAILYSLASAKLEFTQRTSTTNRDFVATFTVTTNTWIHVALTWDGTNLLAYANGVQIGSNTTGAMAGTRGNWGGLQLGPATADIQDGVFYTAALSADEILSLYREREPKRRTNLFCHVPCFPGTNRGVDLSGNALNLPASGTPVDSTIVPPSVGWGSGRTRLILPATSATAIVATGTTQTTGSAALTASAGLVPSGLTRTTGAATMTAAAALVASGLTQTTGAAAMTAAAALVASGLTRTTGAASFGSATFPIIATGTTQTTGTAAMTAAAGLAASGVTQTTGTATMTSAAALVASGVTQTSGSATLAGSLIASGLTQTTGAATFGSVTFPIVATGLTRTTGTATLTAAAALAASGVTQTTGAATFGSATFPVIAAGLTTTTGAAAMGAVVPVVDVPQTFIRAPRETIWITSNPFNPTTYTSVLGSKLLDYWHSEQGISLDGSSNVQTWTGLLAGFVLTQSTASARPTYGPDGTNFNGKNVVQCSVASQRSLFYNPGSTILTQDDKPAFVHVSRFRVAPVPGDPFRCQVNLRGPASTQMLAEISAGAQLAPRRWVVQLVTGARNILDLTPNDTSAAVISFGLSNEAFEIRKNGQLFSSTAVNQPISGAINAMVVGSDTIAVTADTSDISFAMLFLCRQVPNAFEAMQLYSLAKAEWGL